LKKDILIFCATSDDAEPIGEVYPADYEDTISVMAADRFGRRLAKVRREVDLLVLGENVAASGPSWISNKAECISGSSVATALASGIASVLLVYAMCASEDPNSWTKFKTKKHMLKLFQQMVLGRQKPGGKNTYIDPYVLFGSKSQKTDFDWSKEFDGNLL
jgi:hypothetical protein